MIVQIPEDIYSYEHRVWGNFTKRQLICGAIALLIIFPIFIPVFINTGNPRLAALLSMLAAMPILCCGIVKKDGQHMEQILRYRFLQRFKYPQKRKFVMSNLYEIIQQNQKEYEAKDEGHTVKELEKEKKYCKASSSLGKKKNRTGKHSV